MLALTCVVDAQTRWTDLTPEEQAAKIEAVRDARRQRIRAERITHRQKAKAAGRLTARQSRVRDRQFMAVWTRLTPEVRAMYAARKLAERLSRKPEWETQTRAERISSVTDFITNYPATKAAGQQKGMDEALGAVASAYPDGPATQALARVLNAMPDELPALKKAGDPVQLANAIPAYPIAEFPDAEVPDLFSINRQFNWNKPHGRWMNQLLKDIDTAKATGDTATYEALTKRYSAWAEKYLRRSNPDR